MRLFYPILFLTLCLYTNAQGQASTQAIVSYLEGGRTQDVSPLPQAVFQQVEGQEQTYLQTISPYLSDSTTLVKYRAYSVLHQIAQASTSLPFRRQVVNQLLSGTNDNTLSFTTSSFLPQYDKTDFDPAARDSVLRLVERRQGNYISVVKLVGFLDLETAQPLLINHLADRENTTPEERWSIYLALARLGDPSAINYLIRRVSAVPVSDDLMYDVYADLAYTRQKEIVALIIETVMSDDTTCRSAFNDSDATILCAYRAIEYLPGVIADFPWERDVTGDLVVEDYEKALTDIRQWLTDNPLYQMDRSGFE